MQEQKGLSIVIPVFNELNCITKTLVTLIDTLKEVPFEWEVILVNDGSYDGTEKTFDGYRHDKVTIIHHNCNQGYGAAIMTGMDNARFDHVAITDADGTYPFKRISDLYVKALKEGCDMVVGARTGSNVNIPVLRRSGKWIIGKFANYSVGRIIPDINSGFRVFKRREGLLFRHLYPQGFSLTTTMTLAMLTNGYSVEYIPIDYYPRVGKSKIKPVSDTLKFLKLICLLALYFAPLRLFFPLSLLLFLTGFIWGIGSYVISGRLADMSTLLFFLAGVNAGTIGLLAELVNHRTAYQYVKQRIDKEERGR